MFDAQLLKGKKIVVTGGGTGLGKSMATRFAELGADLVITSRRQNVIDETAKELSKHGGKVLAISCDVRDPDQVESMVKETVSNFGKIDILLNNAAGNFISPTENLSSNAFKTVVDIVSADLFDIRNENNILDILISKLTISAMQCLEIFSCFILNDV